MLVMGMVRWYGVLGLFLTVLQCISGFPSWRLDAILFQPQCLLRHQFLFRFCLWSSHSSHNFLSLLQMKHSSLTVLSQLNPMPASQAQSSSVCSLFTLWGHASAPSPSLVEALFPLPHLSPPRVTWPSWVFAFLKLLPKLLSLKP